MDHSVSVSGDISRSIVVTGDGNVVRLRFGSSGMVLPIDRKQIVGPNRRQQQTPPRELDVLDPAQARLPLIGREAEMTDLRAWLESEPDISVHGIIASAGTGKTRLAIGLCAAIDGGARCAEGWIAGFVSPKSLPSIADVHETADFDWRQSTLLVIDYAAQSHEALGRWLDQLAAAPAMAAGVKLRILLLDRHAPEGFGWWHELCKSPLNAAAGRRGLFYRSLPDVLAGLEDIEVRRQVIAKALSATALLHGSATISVPEPGSELDFDIRLSQPVFGNALSLVMAGVIGHERGLNDALNLRSLGMARHLGGRELKRLEGLAGSNSAARAIRHLVAFNGMTGGLPVAGLPQMLQAELALIGSLADAASLAELLQQEFPPTTRTPYAMTARLGTVQPDLIGEAIVVEAFEAPVARQAEGLPALRRAYALTGVETAQALMRLLQDYGYALEDPKATESERATAARLLNWLTTLAVEIEDVEALEPLAYALPKKTLVLRESAAEITGRLAVACEASLQAQEDVPIRSLHQAMVWTRNHATRLHDLRDIERALIAVQHAERYARALVAADGKAFLSELAMTLNTLCNCLNSLGRPEESLAAAQEAVALYRAHTEAQPDASLPGLAGLLSNLSNRLKSLGRREEALVAAQEAVVLYRDLDTVSPETFAYALAGSLNNFADRLVDLGRQEEGLAAVQEAVDIHRSLATGNPDAFTPDLAMSLNNLCCFLSGPEKQNEALAAAEEAVNLYRNLVAVRPDAFMPDLAMSMHNLASRLCAQNRRTEGLAAAQEAVDLRRFLAAARPEAFNHDLAMSLNNLSSFLNDLGRQEEALAAVEEAISLRRTLAEIRPETFSEKLSNSLSLMTNVLVEVGDKLRALETVSENIRVLTPLLEASPNFFENRINVQLQRYFRLSNELGRKHDDENINYVIEFIERGRNGDVRD